MRISPSVANPAAALAEAQNALSEALQLPDTAHAHADGSCAKRAVSARLASQARK